MTSQEPAEQPDPLSPADEARIRELLSDARATGPMPAAVAARLDEAIVGLAAERAHALESGYEPNVRPLVRTRRHRVVAILGAAAAVAVMGLAIGTFFDPDDEAAQDSTSADTAVERGEGDADGEAAPEAAASSPTEDDKMRTHIGPDSGFVAAPQPYTVHPRRLVRDLALIRDKVLTEPGADLYGSGLTVMPDGFGCAVTPIGRRVLVAVRYDGAPAYAAFQEPMGDAQVVEVLQCRTGDVLRSTTLPSPR